MRRTSGHCRGRLDAETGSGGRSIPVQWRRTPHVEATVAIVGRKRAITSEETYPALERLLLVMRVVPKSGTDENLFPTWMPPPSCAVVIIEQPRPFI
jgi:hypothetical protein